MRKLLAIAYSITMTVIILFPPFESGYGHKGIFGSGIFYSFKFIFSETYPLIISLGYLLLEILVVSLIFGVLFYVFKDKK